ncbi:MULTISPECIES: ABC transporter substrate-binding protein [Psychrilyobacter]|uniref:Amino acid ABC transporter substrate-binding protein n=1 Tax=Psychrilyobacter piezotolerans TaxID=2293438 RepID=A0ABX9KIG6_9FUSO|nr:MULTISPECIES: ABC transporter substrate-binding protein [Psychrilyobacter]MCS5420618.1 ABC transporter substrate-binding protein [Psychrilyobacter sp. S5]NDI77363.1 amino acid ABC transporter substrate-binding protein [Psychrilyobacter piezotolerans]RDE63668.1 amino acid ABC transporter substrate-binding protein [Psychrilyobacter sp. S5]REI42012.1 amino acid ABC transporter substrate-binding protein [Psychrilyobacter piezotolerans]
MKKMYWVLIAISLIIVVISGAVLRNKKSIDIGVISTLSGKYSDQGTDILNGVVMAAEDFNKKQKFYQPKINLIIRDDKHDEETAKKAAHELIDKKVAAIIGPLTSKMALVINKIGTERKMLTISPTASSTELSGIDDYFIRLISSEGNIAAFAAKISKEHFNMKKVLIIYSGENNTLASSFKNVYLENFLTDDSDANNVYIKTMNDPVESYFPGIKDKIDGVLLIESPMDAAETVKNIRQLDIDIPILSSDWGFHKDFIVYGGKYIEGTYFINDYDENFSGEAFQRFKKKYQENFNKNINAASLYGYEGLNILSAALKRDKNMSSEELKKEILSPGSNKFFLKPGKFDRYGDREKEISIFQIKNKKFKKIDL